MRKTGVIIAVLAVVVLAVVIVLFVRDSDKEILSDEEIREIVLEQYPGEISELSFDSQTAAYKVKVESGNKAYEVLVDSQSGEVQSLEQTAAKAKDDKEEAEQTEQKQQASDDEAANQKEQAPADVEGNEQEQAMLSQEEIKEIALHEFQGTITELELDEDDGRTLYEVEIENNDDEATIEIDAYTGQVIMVEIDLED